MRKLKFFYVYVDQYNNLKFFASIEKWLKLKDGTKVFVATSKEYPTSLFVLRDLKPSPKMGHVVLESPHERSGRKYIDVKNLMKEMKVENQKSYQCYKYQDGRYKGIRIDFNDKIK